MYDKFIHRRDQFYMTVENIAQAVDELLSIPSLPAREKGILREWKLLLESVAAKLDWLAEQSELFDDIQYPIKYEQDCKIKEAADNARRRIGKANQALLNFFLSQLPKGRRPEAKDNVLGAMFPHVPVDEMERIILAQMEEKQEEEKQQVA